ncbi:hypothetical protein BH11PLA2_BH11PLA2_45070 [soil metagenome]
MRCVTLIIAVISILLPGCGRGGSDAIVPVKSAEFDSAMIAKAIFTTCDKNNDSLIDLREAAVSPGLALAFASIDTDKSKTLSATELISRLDMYKAAVSSSVPVAVYLTLDDVPLVGAKVTLEPEPFFANVLKTATGESDAGGRCGLWSVDGKNALGVSAGLYRIKIEKDNLPAKYNTATILGTEVLTDGRNAENGVYLKLTSH